MSKHTKFSPRYIGTTVPMPENSFLIAKIGKYQKYLIDINEKSELKFKLNENSTSNATKISVLYNDNVIGYVPIKNVDMVMNCLDDAITILAITSLCDNKGIRIIPKSM